MKNIEYNLILCERCKEKEAVCVWDLHGEYYESNICEKCCSELTYEILKHCKGKSIRRKPNPFYDTKYACIYLLYIFITMLTWVFRNPHINYLDVFKLNNFLSFICLTAFGHISADLLKYNKHKSKITVVLILGLEILVGVFGVCAVFTNRLKSDIYSIIIILCLVLNFLILMFLIVIQNSKKINNHIPIWLKNIVIMTGFLSAFVSMIIISIKDLIELGIIIL